MNLTWHQLRIWQSGACAYHGVRRSAMHASVLVATKAACVDYRNGHNGNNPLQEAILTMRTI